MKKTNYDQELMDRYIELNFPEQEYGPMTEKDRQIIADSLGFQSYCLNVAWNEFVDAVATTFPIYRLVTKKSFRITLMLVGIALIIVLIIEGFN